MLSLNPHQIALFAILIVAFALLITERLRNDMVAVLLILALYLSGILKADAALSGFGSEPAIVVVAVFVMSGALQTTGLADMLGNWIGRIAGGGYIRVLVTLMSAIELLSAFTHHVTTTAAMMPVTLNLSREHDIPASKLLMPISFAASLGTTITIIGAPAFLLADGILRQAGRPGLGIFSIAPIGLVISLAGVVFMVLIGQFLLPARHAPEGPDNRFRLDEYLTELAILPDSPFLDKTVGDVHTDSRYDFKVVGWMRGGRFVSRPFDDKRLQEGDVLLVRTPPEEIASIPQEPNLELHPVQQYMEDPPTSNEEEDNDEALVVQAVIAPQSDLIGRTLADIDFRRRYGAIVIGLYRREGWLSQELAKTRLRAGDVLLMRGDQDALNRVRRDPAFLMLVPFQGEPRARRKAYLAGVIMLASIAAASLNLATLEMVMLAGAAAMVLTGCVTARQAYRSIDPRIYVFIAGVIPIGAAMEQTGVSKLVAQWLQRIIGGWNPTLILLGLFLLAGILTQFMSDAGTTAILAPIALILARALGRPPEPFVVTVAMASVAAFFTPIGHHGNLIVYGPGRYEFSDFVRVGTLLTLVVAVVVALMAPLLWRG